MVVDGDCRWKGGGGGGGVQGPRLTATRGLRETDQMPGWFGSRSSPIWTNLARAQSPQALDRLQKLVWPHKEVHVLSGPSQRVSVPQLSSGNSSARQHLESLFQFWNQGLENYKGSTVTKVSAVQPSH